MAVFFLKLFPAIRYNLFFFKEKKKSISTAIWARAFGIKINLDFRMKISDFKKQY